jgi:hypothetical protein
MLASHLERTKGRRQPRQAELSLPLRVCGDLWSGPITGGYTGAQTVIIRHTTKLREQIRAYQQVTAFNGWSQGLVVPVTHEVATPLSAHEPGAVAVAKAKSAQTVVGRLETVASRC